LEEEEEEGLFCFKIVYHGVHYIKKKTDGLLSTINPTIKTYIKLQIYRRKKNSINRRSQS